ncbi:MAG TPA: DUF2335 domain-containing protein [Chloroflexota bacterium]|nr:DUF2335 domain-containing protein [Chloroflexota bacterium]
MHMLELHAGPLPHPDILERYNHIIPNGAERIIHMAERQSEHRIDMERTALNADILQSRLGLAAGFLLSTGVLFLSYTLAVHGNGTAGGLLAGTNITLLAGVFVYGTKTRQQERIEKQKTLTQR